MKEMKTLLGNILGAGLGALIGFHTWFWSGGKLKGGLIGGEISAKKMNKKSCQTLKDYNIKTINWKLKMMEPRQVKLLS